MNNSLVINSRLPTLQSSSSDDTYKLGELWDVIWNRKWPILVAVAVAVLLAIFVVSFLKPVYRASVTLLIDSQETRAVSFEPPPASPLERTITKYQETQIGLLTSRALAAQVAESLDLAHRPQFAPAVPGASTGFTGLLSRFGLGKSASAGANAGVSLTDPQVMDSVTDRLMESIGIEIQGKSSVVKVNVDMRDPAIAAEAANALVNHYIADQVEASTAASRSASLWMTDRLAELGQQLKDSETRLQAYREAQHLIDIKGVDTLSAADLSVSSSQMVDARRSLAEAESEYRQVQGLRQNGWERLSSVPAVIADPLVQKFKAEQAKARAKVDGLSGRFGPKHPAMESAQSELNAATQNLRGQVEQVVAGIERNYQLAAANNGSLQASVDTNKSQLQDISRKEFQLQTLQREVDSNRELYDTFLNRLKETTATGGLGATNNSRVVDLAQTPGAPLQPKKMLIVALVATLALLLASAVALLRESLRRPFKSREEVQSSLNLPVLGILPLLDVQERKDVARLFGAENQQPFSESIRTIRTELMLNSSIDQEHQIIVVASAVPGEGKTSVSINLAHSFSQMGRVLLIDADLRRSSFNKIFNFPTGTLGLTDLIENGVRAGDCIRHVDGIDVLCAGSDTSSPLEMLSSQRFAKALVVLRGKYQRIVIDSPPTQAVSDALILSRHADTMVYVVKSTTPITTAEKGLKRLLQFNAPVQGVVINQVDIKQDPFGLPL